MRYKPKTEEEWLELRKKVLTATEIASVLGVNYFQSSSKMWENKTNSTFKGNAYTFMGQLLEPIVIKLSNVVLEREFIPCETPEERIFLANKTIGMGATPDAEDNQSFLECKTTKPANFIRYSEAPPKSYIIQVAAQLILEKKKKNGYLAIMSTDLSQDSPELKIPLVVYEIQRHKTLENLIKEEVARFWQCQKENKQFRCQSSVRRKVHTLCAICCRRIV